MAKVGQPAAKNNAKSTNSLSVPKAPTAITSLHIDAMPGVSFLNSKEIGYRDELAKRLKLLLKLPEYGEVKIKLTLQRSGKVLKVGSISRKRKQQKSY